MKFLGKIYGRFFDAVALLFSGGVILGFVVLAFVFFVTIGSIVLISNSYEEGTEQDQIAKHHEQMKSVRGYIVALGV
jgi:hypothetical protein